MIEIAYSPTFVKQYGNCEKELKEEIKEKINLLKNRNNHKHLKVHKLHGFKDRFSFSVNYKFRIIFCWLNKKEVYLLVLGNHDIYK